MSTTPVKPMPATRVETVEEQFRRLAAAGHKDTDCLSSMAEAENHPAYQEIVRLGPDVVPLLLCDLAENHTHWFAALEAITGATARDGVGPRRHPPDGASLASLGQAQRLPMATPLIGFVRRFPA
ncbi:MAG TPA: hypothetical protein VMS17_04315 [Gemmataceae bacterium]|nr:hypothetical protein [Gemmataceae bacterium]